MKKDFASRLLKSRFQPPQELRRRVFEAPRHPQSGTARRRGTPPRLTGRPSYVKGVVNGQFVRVKVPGREPPSTLTKLPSPATPPVQHFSQPQTTAGSLEHHHNHLKATAVPTTLQEFTRATRAEQKEFFREYWDRLKAWTKHNFAVIVLNFGSICSLVGFTRSDVRQKACLVSFWSNQRNCTPGFT